MIKLTLEFSWNEIRSFEGRSIKTLEGPYIDVLSLKKAEINCSNFTVHDQFIEFPESLIGNDWEHQINSNSVIYFKSVNNNGADGYVKGYYPAKDQIIIYFFDSQGVDGHSNVIINGNKVIPTFGLEFEDLFNKLENSGVIKRVSIKSFLVINKKAFYLLFGQKRYSQEEFTQLLIKQFND